MAKTLPEFANNEDPAWAQARYVEDLERELEGTRVRGDKEYEEVVLKELARFGKGKTTAKK